MSAELYIKKVKEVIDSKVKANTEYISKNPYPVNELKQILDKDKKDSPISLMYDESGKKELKSPLTAEQEAAINKQVESTPGILKKLEDGAKSLSKVKWNEKYSAIDWTSYVNTLFERFVSYLNIEETKDELFDSHRIFSTETKPNTFFDYIKSANITTPANEADPLLHAAFIDLYTQKYGAYVKPEFKKGSSLPEGTSVKSPMNTPMGEFNSWQKKTDSAKSTSPINTPSNSTQPAVTDTSNPINNKPTETVGNSTETAGSQPTVTSKTESVQPEVASLTESKTPAININLETTDASLGSTKTGEVLNLTNTNSTTNNSINSNVANSSTENNNKSTVAATSNSPSINESTTKNNKNSIFNNIKDSVINKAKGILPTLQKEALEYLGVGKSKITPAINAVNKIENYLDNRQESRIENSKSASTVNNMTSTQGGNSTTESATNTTNKSNSVNNSISVDSTKPSVAMEPAVMSAPVTNNTGVMTTNNDNKSTENQVTYGGATQLAAPVSQSNTQSTSTSESTENTQNSAATFDVSELVNEMRSIKLILLGGIDINNKL